MILGVTTTTINNSQSLFNDNNSFMVYAQQIMEIPSGGFSTEPQQPEQPGEYTAGTIASIQNDKEGIPTWLLSGAWKGAIINIDKGETNSDTLPSINTNNDNLLASNFEATFDMVMLNGSSLHEHSIYNFTLSDISMIYDKNSVFNGTATITMKDIPVNDVPISIKTLNNNVISIWTDPAKINDHFGNTPIYGQIIQDIVIKK
ncbi:MAG TPA: hypothetical protein VE524_06045 [Nitrososphaeraceae archaeon]|nr:hypothetical protein [Nitrososphaeraceae archaeon]